MSLLCNKTLFNQALFDAISQSDDVEDTCPISGIKLEPSRTIQLECGHKFDAIGIYNEVIRQKKHPPSTETQILRKNEIKCPLCRQVQPRLLTPHSDCPPVVGVNSPLKLCSFPHKCEYVFSKGKKTGQRCNRGCVGEHCSQHSHITPKSQRKLCKHIMIRGPRKGQPCGTIVTSGELCKRHSPT